MGTVLTPVGGLPALPPKVAKQDGLRDSPGQFSPSKLKGAESFF